MPSQAGERVGGGGAGQPRQQRELISLERAMPGERCQELAVRRAERKRDY